MERVALEAGISVVWLRRIEKGEANITIDTITRIASALGVMPQVFWYMELSDEEIIAALREPPGVAYLGAEVQHIGIRIVVLRKGQGVSQKELAEKSKVSLARLRDVEHGCANASVKLLARVAGALGVTLVGLSAPVMAEEEVLRMVHEAKAMVGKEAA